MYDNEAQLSELHKRLALLEGKLREKSEAGDVCDCVCVCVEAELGEIAEIVSALTRALQKTRSAATQPERLIGKRSRAGETENERRPLLCEWTLAHIAQLWTLAALPALSPRGVKGVPFRALSTALTTHWRLAEVLVDALRSDCDTPPLSMLSLLSLFSSLLSQAQTTLDLLRDDAFAAGSVRRLASLSVHNACLHCLRWISSQDSAASSSRDELWNKLFSSMRSTLDMLDRECVESSLPSFVRMKNDRKTCSARAIVALCMIVRTLTRCSSSSVAMSAFTASFDAFWIDKLLAETDVFGAVRTVSENDADLFDWLVDLFEVRKWTNKEGIHAVSPLRAMVDQLEKHNFSACEVFIAFVSTVLFCDHSVLLDLLCGTETQALFCLLQFAKTTSKREIAAFMEFAVQHQTQTRIQAQAQTSDCPLPTTMRRKARTDAKVVVFAREDTTHIPSNSTWRVLLDEDESDGEDSLSCVSEQPLADCLFDTDAFLEMLRDVAAQLLSSYRRGNLPFNPSPLCERINQLLNS